MPDKLMSQKDFLAKIRAEVPELEDVPDIQLMNKIFERRPELRSQIENPMAGDAAAAKEQSRLQRRSQSIVDPEFWKGHPTAAAFSRAALDTVPAIGAMGGGALATPETFGTGTIAGGALGAGVGRGLRDITTQMLGLENSSPMDKAKNIGLETGIAAITPGIAEAAMHPIDTAKMATKAYLSKLPRRIQPWVVPQAVEDFANSALGSTKRNPMSSTVFKNVPEVEGNVVPGGGVNDRGEAFTEGVFRHSNAGEVGPAKTRFGRVGNPNEPIPNSPKGPNTEPDIMESKSLPPGKIPKQLPQNASPESSPIVHGSKLILDKEQTSAPMINNLMKKGFKYESVTEDGHYVFTKSKPVTPEVVESGAPDVSRSINLGKSPMRDPRTALEATQGHPLTDAQERAFQWAEQGSSVKNAPPRKGKVTYKTSGGTYTVDYDNPIPQTGAFPSEKIGPNGIKDPFHNYMSDLNIPFVEDSERMLNERMAKP